MHSILFFIALTITSVLGIHTGKEWTETISSVTVDLSTIPRGHSTGTGINPSPTVPSLTGTIFIPGGTQSVTVITPGGTSITVPVTVSTTPGGTEVTSVVPGGTTTASVPVPDGTTVPGTTATDLTATTGTATTGTTAGAQTAAPSSAAVPLGHGDFGMALAVSGIISGSLAFFLGL
ncbi:hypothetical protein EST38_g10659 [Candolleomyces aberdarensis]|uniref:Uncharacterized protein n=1 Tax=Candolleomyces aberdarensis TaxID=2316362 RepID=A0A4Q2D7I7_9AGAR|nr:hypothetical protein EST38_g10659 [Candolleomyces aberdarensis]